MSARELAFRAGAGALFVLLVAAMSGLPPLGGYQGVYGATLDEVAVRERHTTDVVSAVTFDYRGLDTLGEELILFASVLGVATLLRRQRDEREDRPSDEESLRRHGSPPRAGDAVRAVAAGLVLLTVAFGVYVVAHGTATPGGGFQGGVILATAPLVVYLASGPGTLRRIAPEARVAIAEAAGAAGYVIVGFLGPALGRPFLANVLPLGEPGTAVSGGTIFALNLTVGLEVAAGLVALLLTFERGALELHEERPR